jgi:hypothetical protein
VNAQVATPIGLDEVPRRRHDEVHVRFDVFLRSELEMRATLAGLAPHPESSRGSSSRLSVKPVPHEAGERGFRVTDSKSVDGCIEKWVLMERNDVPTDDDPAIGTRTFDGSSCRKGRRDVDGVHAAYPHSGRLEFPHQTFQGRRKSLINEPDDVPEST